MGDSETVQLGVLAAMVIVPGAVVAFAIACCVRDKGFRAVVGVLLLGIAVFAGFFSAVVGVFFAILGVAALSLASKTRQLGSASVQSETDQPS